jgi:hypothetical protein
MTENEIKEEKNTLFINSSSTENPDIQDISTQAIKSKFSESIDFFRDLIIIFLVVIFVRTFIAAPFQISGSSMEASYHD